MEDDDNLPLSAYVKYSSEVKHAMNSERLPFCGDGDSTFGWDTIDRVVFKFIDCPGCLRIIAMAVLEKMRKVGAESLKEEPHNCPTSLSLQSQLSDSQIVVATLQRRQDQLQAELRALRDEVQTLRAIPARPSVPAPSVQAPAQPKAVAKPEPKEEEDAAINRFRLLELD